ncbi:MAG TPA: Rieske (2Fe-2S) protein [Hyphomicrobiales bacterium]|nr:Rieske (2Fe-2S) protein [Hyphomicrobiales bacterium]
MSGTLLHVCRLDDVAPQDARAFMLGERSLLVVRLDAARVRVYLNRCPHLGVPLNWQPDRFLDNEGAFVQCANHGALFEKDTGLCVLGPCRGDSLWEITSTVVAGAVLIDTAELPSAAVPH